jgi:hypothetical protein
MKHVILWDPKRSQCLWTVLLVSIAEEAFRRGDAVSDTTNTGLAEYKNTQICRCFQRRAKSAITLKWREVYKCTAWRRKLWIPLLVRKWQPNTSSLERSVCCPRRVGRPTWFVLRRTAIHLMGNLMRRMIASSVPITRTGSSSVERELVVQGASDSSSLVVSSNQSARVQATLK